MALRARIARPFLPPSVLLFRAFNTQASVAVEEHKYLQRLAESQRLHPHNYALLAKTHSQLVDFYAKHNNTDRVLDHSKKMYALLQKVQPPANEALMKACRTILGCLSTAGKSLEAEPFAVQHLAFTKDSKSSDKPSIAMAQLQLAQLQESLGKSQEAAQNLLEAGETARSANSPSILGLIYLTLANVRKNQMQLPDAMTYIDTAIAQFEQVPEEATKALLTISAQSVKGSILCDLSHLEDAEACYKSALARCTSLELPSNTQSSSDSLILDLQTERNNGLSTLLNNLGMLYLNTGKLDEAERLFQEKLANDSKVYPEVHPVIAICHHNLASVAEAKGDNQAAKTGYLKALEIRRKTLNNAHPHIAIVHQNLANVCKNLKQIDEAEQHLQLAIELGHLAFDQTHPFLGNAFSDMGVLHSMKRKWSDAAQYHEKALEIRKKNYPETHESIGQSHLMLGQAYRNLTQFDKSHEHYSLGLAIMKKYIPEDHLEMATILNNLGTAQYFRKNLQEAEDSIKKAVEIRTKALKDSHPLTLSARRNLANVLLAENKFPQAESELKQVLRFTQGQNSIEAKLLAQLLVMALEGQKKTKEVEGIVKKYGLGSG